MGIHLELLGRHEGEGSLEARLGHGVDEVLDARNACRDRLGSGTATDVSVRGGRRTKVADARLKVTAHLFEQKVQPLHIAVNDLPRNAFSGSLGDTNV